MMTRPPEPVIPPELSGKWIAWDRKSAEIVGSGNSFDAAKGAAAKAGHREVMIGKAEASTGWARHKHLLWMAAVFISQAASQAADTLGEFSDLLP